MSKHTPRWSEQDRQDFADGNRLRAQSIPGRRWYEDDFEPDLCSHCRGLGCDRCQQTGYAGGREP